jgi:hypothetical protein
MLTNTKPLLLVDDDLTNQDLLSRRLKRAGYATEVAGSGYEALDVLARREVELVLLDSMMPERRPPLNAVLNERRPYPCAVTTALVRHCLYVFCKSCQLVNRGSKCMCILSIKHKAKVVSFTRAVF